MLRANPNAPLTTIQAAATSSATSNGYTTAPGGVSVAVYQPPLFGAYAGDTSKVQVQILQPTTPYFAALFLKPFSVETSAVAGVDPGAKVCVLALSQLNFGGTGNGNKINTPGCAVASDGTGSSAISSNGNGTVTADTPVISAGGCQGNGGDPICSASNTKTYQPAVSDPFKDTVANVPLPDLTNCTDGNNAGSTLRPYYDGNNATSGTCYKGTVSVTSSTSFSSGTYYFNSANLSFANGASLTAKDVTFILTGNSTVSFGNNVSGLTLLAPAQNSHDSRYDGLLFYSADVTPMSFGGNSMPTLSGIMYFPNASVAYAGTTGVTGCSVLVAKTITLQGTPSFDATSCPPSTVPAIGGSRVRLLE